MRKEAQPGRVPPPAPQGWQARPGASGWSEQWPLKCGSARPGSQGGLKVRSRALKGFKKGSGGCTGLNSVHPPQIHVHLDPQKVNLFGNKTFLHGIQSKMLV